MAAFELDDRLVLAALHQLQQLVGDLRPAFAEIGEDLKESTQQRFVSTTAPDGSGWALNSVLSTLLYKEGDRPLTGETGALGDTIAYQVLRDSLDVGSPLEYAAMQQFGGTKDEFPQLWGDIPVRPFLGVSDDDATGILAVLSRHINAALSG